MNTKTADRIKYLVIGVIALVMLYALYVSKEHVTEVAQWLGIPGWQAKTAFILVDVPALLGKLMGLPCFKPATRKAGREMTYVSGSISLACNIGAGLIIHSWGAAGWGAFVVGMFLYLENKATKIGPAAGVTRKKNAAPASKPRTAAQIAGAKRAGATRKARAAMPTSPGMGPVRDLINTPELDEIYSA